MPQSLRLVGSTVSSVKVQPVQMSVAFLRGINTVGRRVKNAHLCAIFEVMGFENVSAFLASGNVLFDPGFVHQTGAESLIAQQLEAELGYPVPTFVRTAEQVARAAAMHPFSNTDLESSTNRMQVVLLSDTPTASDCEEVMALSTADDRLYFHDRELYWLPNSGMSESVLNLKRIEKTLGVFTVRTQRTFARLSQKTATGHP